MANIVPQVHSSGIFKLASPFDTLLTPNVWYTCIAVRKLEEIRLKGIDPFKTYYQPKSIDSSKYEQDFKAGVSIVTLRSTSGDLKHVPSSYLLSFPSGNGYLYSVIGLGIKLGSLPVDLDLTDLENKLKEVVSDTLGVSSEVKQVQLSPVTIVEKQNHLNYESARKAKIRDKSSNLAKLKALTTENEALRQRVTELERFAIAKSR